MLAKGPKRGHFGPKIDFSESDPEGGLGPGKPRKRVFTVVGACFGPLLGPFRLKMASQRLFRGLQRGRKRVILGSKIDFSEIDPEGGLRAWGAQKTHFYGGFYGLL